MPLRCATGLTTNKLVVTRATQWSADATPLRYVADYEQVFASRWPVNFRP